MTCPDPARCDFLGVCQGKCQPLGPGRTASITGRKADKVWIEETVATGHGTPYVKVAPPALPVWVAKRHPWRKS